MIVALHSAPKGFFKAFPPYSNKDLLRFVRKAASQVSRQFKSVHYEILFLLKAIA